MPTDHSAKLGADTPHGVPEAALRGSEARLRAALQHAADAVLLLDRDGRVLFTNPALGAILGTDEVAVGQRLWRFVAEGSLPEARAWLASSVDRGGAPQRAVLALEHAGRVRFVEAIATSALEDADVGAVVINLRDITDQRALEARVQDAQKMEAVGRLAAGVAHDFNNALTVIIGYADACARAIPDGHQARRDLAELTAAAGRSASLTRQLLALGRRQLLAPARLDLRAFLLSRERMLNVLVGESVGLEVSAPESLPGVWFDESQLEQVLLNLVSNARDAMPSGGSLVIEAAPRSLEGESHARAAGLPEGPHVVLSVTDSGVGMDERTRACIFEPFFTTKGSDKGSGLGLAMVLGIVRQSGGFVLVESEPGSGSRFDVYLPVEPDAVTLPGAPTGQTDERSA